MPSILGVDRSSAIADWFNAMTRERPDFDARLITGEPNIEPRVVPAPVRMPLPPARHQGSIYENQSDASRRYFQLTDDATPAPRT